MQKRKKLQKGISRNSHGGYPRVLTEVWVVYTQRVESMKHSRKQLLEHLKAKQRFKKVMQCLKILEFTMPGNTGVLLNPE